MKSVATHAVLALLGLVLAYLTWTRPAESEQPTTPGQTTIFECSRDALTKLEFEGKTRRVSVAPAKSKEGVVYWINSQPKKREPKPTDAPDASAHGLSAQSDAGGSLADAGALAATSAGADAGKALARAGDAGAEPKPEDEKEKPARKRDPDGITIFAANPEFEQFLAWVAPLRADRALGKLSQDKLATFGFDDASLQLRLACAGRELALELGGTTFGAADRYARDPKSGEAYLLTGDKITDLESAHFKFLQSALHNFGLEDIDKVTVRAGGKQRDLLHRNRKVRDQALWVDAAAPDRRNELFGNWLDRLASLRTRSYLGPDDEPGADLQIEAKGMRTLATIAYEADGKERGKLELVRVDTERGGMYYGRSEATHRWVVLTESQAKQVDDDLALVVGAEGATAPSPEGAKSAPHNSAAGPHAPLGHGGGAPAHSP